MKWTRRIGWRFHQHLILSRRKEEKNKQREKDIRRYSNGGALYVKVNANLPAILIEMKRQIKKKNCSTLLFVKEITGFLRSWFHCSTLSSFTTKSQWWHTAQWYDESQNAIEIGEDNQHIFAFNRRRISNIFLSSAQIITNFILVYTTKCKCEFISMY